MKSNAFTLIRFLVAILTIIIIVSHPYIPKKKQLIHPLVGTSTSINGYFDPISQENSVSWIDEDNFEWQCDFKPRHTEQYSCGFSFSWGQIYDFEEPVSSRASAPKCLSAESDEDGDGWGWENDQSCIVSASDKRVDVQVDVSSSAPPEVTPKCVNPESDEDGDGWGWENDQSCIVSETDRKVDVHADTQVDVNGASLPPAVMPECVSSESDDDGDGWGWENNQSCIVNFKKSETSVVCHYPTKDVDGNGWSWENGKPCKFEQSSLQNNGEDNNTEKQLLTDDEKNQGPVVVSSIDISQYNGFNIKVNYEGSSPLIRFYVQNFNPAYSNVDDIRSNKFMSKAILTDNLRDGEYFVEFSGFNVAQWWVKEFDVPREWASLEFDQIVGIGFDHIQYGLHRVRIDRVELVGERIKMETLLMSLAIFWVIYILTESVARYYLLRKEALLGTEHINQLSTTAEQLQSEKRELEVLAITDSLTGILNRAGVSQFTTALFTHDTSNVGVMVVDIDHFKKINDQHGHDIGDEILKSLTSVISSNIRAEDIFARWGGEEFVLISPSSNKEVLIKIANKLRVIISEYNFVPTVGLKVTISIGVTLSRTGEVYDDVFKRSDVALYTAKKTRNCVAFL